MQIIKYFTGSIPSMKFTSKKIAILKKSIAVSMFLSYGQAMDNPTDNLKERFNLNKINSLIVGGSHIKTSDWKYFWILSDYETCLTVNSDETSKPDFNADGFDEKSIALKLSPLFTLVASDSEKYGLTTIKYEHVGSRLDLHQITPTFEKVCALFQKGVPGHFEYSSFWMRLIEISNDHPYTIQNTYKFKLSSDIAGVGTALKQKLAKLEAKKRSIPRDTDEDRHYFKLELSSLDSIRVLYQSKDYNFASEIEKTGMIIDTYKRHLEKIEQSDFGENTAPYKRLNLYIQILETINEMRLNSKGITYFSGFDKIIDEHFEKTLDPLIIDIMGTHKKYFYEDSPLFKYYDLFEKKLNLTSITLSLHTIPNRMVYSLTISGTKNPLLPPVEPTLIPLISPIIETNSAINQPVRSVDEVKDLILSLFEDSETFEPLYTAAKKTFSEEASEDDYHNYIAIFNGHHQSLMEIFGMSPEESANLQTSLGEFVMDQISKIA